MKPALLILLILLAAGNIYSQDISTNFRIQNAKKEPIIFATIKVRSNIDSTFSKTFTSDSTGSANISLSRGQYFISISSVDHHPFEKAISVSSTSHSFLFTLKESSKTLDAVVVTAQKPLMRQEDDKTIVDAENLAASSTTGYEVIEKTPGLFVDQDGNIYINSLTPATVYINGREMKMSAADIASMLKSLPPNSIAQIEILRTPSAKYDASGSGGIVNVVLKKGVKIGMTGSVNSGWQQGEHGNKFLGFSINNNNGRVSSYLNLNYSNRKTFERITTDRIFHPDSMLRQNALTIYPSFGYFAGYGYSVEMNRKWSINFDGRISYNDFRNNTNNRTIIGSIINADTARDELNLVSNDGNSLLFNNGISLKNKIDSIGSEWTSDASFTYSKNKSAQDFGIYNGNPLQQSKGGDGLTNSNRMLFSAQTDLKLKFPSKYSFETGLKTSVLLFNNTADYFLLENGVRSKDFGRTNKFQYRENINAAYIQGSKSIRDIIIKTGLRMENTNMEGRQIIPKDTSFSIHRTDLFPYVYLSKKVMSIAGYDLRAYLVYRRTISRPVYEQLNPFPRYIDQYLSEVGNPTLRPQFTTNYEANISVNEHPLIALGLNKTKDIFTSVIYQADSSQSQAYRTVDNLGSNKEWYFRALGAIPPGKRYFFVAVAQYNHNFYQGLYQNKPLQFKKGTWTFYTYHTFKLDKLSLLTLNGFLRLKGQQQFYELSSFGALNASINRQFLKQKLIVTLSANDIFATQKNNFTLQQGSVNAKGFRQGDTRRFGINLRYNFGIRKKEESNNMFNIENPGM